MSAPCCSLDDEGSKSGVAMDAWPPRASSRYPARARAAPSRGPTRARASPAYPAVMGLSKGALESGGRLYLSGGRVAAPRHTLPVVEARKRPFPLSEGASAFLSPADRPLSLPDYHLRVGARFALGFPPSRLGTGSVRLSQHPGVSPSSPTRPARSARAEGTLGLAAHPTSLRLPRGRLRDWDLLSARGARAPQRSTPRAPLHLESLW